MKTAVAVVFALAVIQSPPQQPAPVFKGGTTVVPLTVTVVDKNGTPVKDLKASDFTVVENKRPREIVNFFPQEFVAGPVPPDSTTINRVRDEQIVPQTRRTFLIVLGYGRIEHPTDALEGAIDLVRNRLLPQDVVAVMAFHRTTVFTTDHERIAQLLERYRKAHEQIVGAINNYRVMARAPVVQGSAPPGNAPIPDRILQQIDEIFLGPSPTGAAPGASAFLRNTADLLLGMDRVIPVVEKPGQFQETLGSISKILGDSGEGLTDEVLLSTKLKLYAGVEYLRALEGEKHMVFFSGLEGAGTLGGSDYRPDDRGGTVMRATTGRYEAALNTASGASSGGVARNADEAAIVAQRAADARVVVDMIATNGTTNTGGGDPAGRIVTELTGGSYTSVDMAVKAVAKLDEASRFSYLLGYTPSDPTQDGKYRDVSVSVNRPDVTVRFRHGYFAAAEPPPLELAALVKKSRIDAALTYDQAAKDIPLQVTAAILPQMGIQTTVRVDITIDAAPLALELRDGKRVGQIELQVYCGDAKQAVIGDAGQTVDLDAGDQQYQQWLQAGIHRTVRVPVSGTPKYVKVVAYDYGSDRVGSALVTIR